MNYSYIVPLLIEIWNVTARPHLWFLLEIIIVNTGREESQFLFHCNLGTDKGRCDVAEGAKDQVGFH